jgi:hypothetical protein
VERYRAHPLDDSRTGKSYPVESAAAGVDDFSSRLRLLRGCRTDQADLSPLSVRLIFCLVQHCRLNRRLAEQINFTGKATAVASQSSPPGGATASGQPAGR